MIDIKSVKDRLVQLEEHYDNGGELRWACSVVNSIRKAVENGIEPDDRGIFVIETPPKPEKQKTRFK